MKTIFKTWKKATYFKGAFKLRKETYASPIDFPSVFVAYGKAVKSGNWQRVTNINTPEYVINNFFDTIGHDKHDEMFQMWEYCKQLSKVTWEDVRNNKTEVLRIIELANTELNRLDTFR